MSIRSLADFNGCVPLGPVIVLARTTTVTTQGAYLVDQVTEVGTFVGHGWGLSHGHGQSAVGRANVVPEHASQNVLRTPPAAVAKVPVGA